MHVGKRLYKLRRKMKLTQSEFSEGTCSAEHLDDIEQGSKAAKAKLLQAVANKFKLKDDYFLLYAVQDRTLAAKLKAYYEVIYGGEEENPEADQIYTEIVSTYPQIQCLEQELKFCLLRTYQLLKQLCLEEAFAFYEAFMEQAKFTTDEVDKATCYHNATLGLYEMNSTKKVYSICESALQIYLKNKYYKFGADRAKSLYKLKTLSTRRQIPYLGGLTCTSANVYIN